jgi:hypothetical protein
MEAEFANIEVEELNLDDARDLRIALWFIENGDDLEKFYVLKLMTVHKDPDRFSKYFIGALSDTSDLVVIQALEGLELVDDIEPETVDQIHDCLDNFDPTVRWYAIQTLCTHRNGRTDAVIQNYVAQEISLTEIVCCYFYLFLHCGGEYEERFLKQLETEEMSAVRWFCGFVLDSNWHEADFDFSDLKERLAARLAREKALLNRSDLIKRLEETFDHVSECIA